MTPERWQRITGIVDAALAHEAAERLVFVASTCGDDDELWREVASMLAVHQGFGESGEPAARAATPLSLTRGTRLGPYEVESLLGVGGMGAVYRARDSRLHRYVALKVLLPDVADNQHRLARFSREARILASMSHPNIAQIHGLEQWDPSAGSRQGVLRALVMELVEGPTLADRIAQGAIPIDEALEIGRQIAEALEAAHECGIIHRDLKPANVSVRADGTVKVLDFGLAKDLHVGDRGEPVSGMDAATVTRPGLILGTTSYMAPEQAKGKPVDRRADIWAFGCVLFEMLTGHRAFAGETHSDVLVRILEHEPDWQTLPAGTPATIRRLVHRCLVKEPRRRLDSAAVACFEIDEARGEPTSVVPASTARRGTVWRPIAWASAGAGATLLVVMAFAGRAFFPEPPEPLVVTSISLDEAVSLGTPGVHFAVAPNGRTVVFASSYGGTRVLYRRDLNSIESEPIVGTEGGSDQFFSHDGQRLGFETQSELWTAPLGGGTPQRLAPNQPLRGGTWGTDDNIIFGRVGSGLWMASGAGGEPRQLTIPEQGDRHELPQLLPGNSAVLFTILSSNKPSRAAVHLLGTGETRTVFEGVGARFVDSGHIVFGRQGKLWAVGFDPHALKVRGIDRPVRDDVLWSAAGYPQFTVGSGLLVYVRASQASAMMGKSVPTWVDRQGRRTAIAIEAHHFLLARLSPTADRFVVGIGASGELWTYDFGRGTLTRLTTDRVVAYSAPVWTPDASRVAFTTWFDGDVGLGWLPPDGSGPVEELIKGVGMRSFERTHPAFLPDGSGVVLTGLAPGKAVEDLLFVPLTGERGLESLFEAAGVERNAAMAPSGRFVAYNSDESGRSEVYVRPFPNVGVRKWQISTEGGGAPTWTRGSSEIVFVDPQGRMMAAAVRSDGSDWFDFSRPEPLFRLGPPGCYCLDRGWDVTADGERFLAFERADVPDAMAAGLELVLVQHWDDELTRLLPRKP